jgi:hypothetical protein
MPNNSIPIDTSTSALNNAYIPSGITTVFWGTYPFLPTNSNISTTINTGGSGGFMGYYIVESIRSEERVDIHEIAQGSGLIVGRIAIWQGRRYTITVIDDTNFPPPAPLSQLGFYDIAAKNAIIKAFTLISISKTLEYANVAKRELVCEALTGIELFGNNTPNTPALSS